MKIKRTIARNMREGLKKIREEYGPDAVILSNKKVPEGIEIISALDFDEDAILGAAQEEKKSPFAALSQPRPIVDEMIQEPMVKKNAKKKENAKQQFADAKSRIASMFEDEANDEVVSLSSIKSASTNAAPVNSAIRDAINNIRSQHPDIKEELNLRDEIRNPMSQEKSEPRLNLADTAAHAEQDKKDQVKAMNNLLSNIQWPHDSALNDLKQEVTSLRGLFEDQLSVLEWIGVSQKNPNRISLLKRLHGLGISRGVAKKLAEAVLDEPTLEHAWQKALKYLTNAVQVTDDDILNNAGVVAVVGPTGVGKTTTVAKLAARYTLRHGRGQVALVTTDCYRIGAHDQLRSFGKILGVPVYVASDNDELKEIIDSLADKQLILVDTAGMSQRDIKLAEQLQMLDIGSELKIYLAMSANTQQRALNETVRAFSKIDLQGCILTKVDECANLGGILTTLINHTMPLAYVGVGQRVPEDLQPARADELVKMAVELSTEEDLDDEGFAVAFAGMQRKHGSLGIS
ncbi:MAG: flagellar biosynthesis protein FlhF, partial [Gammaproteobacteria bacterium]